MYKNQKDTEKRLIQVKKYLESVVIEEKSLKIGYGIYNDWNGSEWIKKEGDVFLTLNKSHSFFMIEEYSNCITAKIDTFEDDFISYDKNLFLNLVNIECFRLDYSKL